MAAIGRFNTLQITKHTDFGLYVDGGSHGEILLPKRYIPADEPTEVDDWLNLFVYLDSDDRPIATTLRPKAQVGEFASLKVVQINKVGLFLDWGLPKDLLLPHSEEKRPLREGDYAVVYLYLDRHTQRITATSYLDRYLDKSTPTYKPGEAVDLLVVSPTDLGFKAIINNSHWGLIHRNEAFKFLRKGTRDRGYIREIRPDGKISLSLQPLGAEARDALQQRILEALAEQGGRLALSDRSPPEAIAEAFGVSKGNFKKALGALLKRGLIVIHSEHVEATKAV